MLLVGVILTENGTCFYTILALGVVTPGLPTTQRARPAVDLVRSV